MSIGYAKVYRQQPSRCPSSVVNAFGSIPVPIPFSFDKPLVFGPIDGTVILDSPFWIGVWFGEVLLFEHPTTTYEPTLTVINGTFTLEGL